MEASGLQKIIEICRSFGVDTVNRQLKMLQEILDEDEKRFRERLDQEILRDMNDPMDVYNTIRAKVEETKAKDYFLSMMQHLLLIREEGPQMVHYYQLIDSIITDVVLDKKLAGAEQRLGHSVDRIIAQFNEADRYQSIENDAAQARAHALRLKLEKESLEEEIAQGQEGLVGQLKEKVTHLEQKLAVSRENTSRLQGQLETQRLGYEEQIAQLEAQIMELFRMLKEVGKGMEKIIDNGSMDRKTLIDTLERHLQRDKTISILEGRDKRWKRATENQSESDEIEDEIDATPGKSSNKRRPSKKRSKGAKSMRASELQNGRISQFMDADDEDAQEQIQQQLAAGVTIVSWIDLFPLIKTNGFIVVSAARRTS